MNKTINFKMSKENKSLNKTENSVLNIFLCDICGQEKNGRKFPVLDENWNKQNGLNQCEDCFKECCEVETDKNE